MGVVFQLHCIFGFSIDDVNIVCGSTKCKRSHSPMPIDNDLISMQINKRFSIKFYLYDV